ncbi:hypothetical protein OG601_27425 [Streptomyces sp. NBC_01239]|uniref:hypothetical protein n=1 Tax=Streptomyces sp. NBC_01239 TaxID=2903792 RepID=UPI002259004E|nr:hypothetical protein [Streptomyces sp. NBC_01239]MCX4814330.1 hypothetical protein [Streptomyces sp. NBC_01239]
MRTWKRAGIAAVLTAAASGIVSPAASAAPMQWETSLVHRPAPTQSTAITPAGETGTVTVLCSGGCYQ